MCGWMQAIITDVKIKRETLEVQATELSVLG